MVNTDNDTPLPAEVKTTDYFITFLDGQQHAKFSPAKHQIAINDGTDIKFFELSYTSSRILELLILRADEIVSREEIFSFAWPRRVVGQNSLNQAISNIRELFHDDDHRAIIQTFPRRGYRFNSTYLNSVSVQKQDCFIDLKHHPQPGIPQTEPERTPLYTKRPELSTSAINIILAALIAILLATLVGRFDWLLAEQAGLFLMEETEGDLSTFYTTENEPELFQMKTDLQLLHTRIGKMINQPETVIFNRMHGFYEITCIDRGTSVRFLTIEKSQLGAISDQQLKECLE